MSDTNTDTGTGTATGPGAHPAGQIVEVVVPAAERARLAGELDAQAARFPELTDPELLAEAAGLGQCLPVEARRALTELRYGESCAGVVVRHGPVADDPGPTPRHWRESAGRPTDRFDRWLLWLAAQLGDPLCWASIQDGRLVADVLPVAGQEEAQTGHGSAAELAFHVEDAFHEARCDALALACLRNPDAVPTTVASVTALDLAALDVETLLEPRFRIAPDPEHLRDLPAGAAPDPLLGAVLSGPPAAPCLRVDPAFTTVPAGDRRAAAAFDALCAQLAAGLVDVALHAGDVLLLDNHRAVHGRRPFRARYDGTDRWLRKITVNRDLRRTRALRRSATSRVLHPFG
ncbi:TauD/TfdA family dioxygenase [Streptomyces sp. DSM 44915]|uniref:TauD/TfdA family dioxygenase n=1 Tax=Streptomyces chisholmiae TaxID=3075540 RepID=A0ABU2JVF5_9ACTN|nr:TauD/TfdA family dioxygenase [Streptomyces sp. DSM 44915]MDT0268968.1 TauD/TfdA family dioxygenase [Streptomyces sp. DSM 44915]